VPSGTKVFDWEIPKEWNIKDAYVKDPSGKKIIDFKDSNLHVLNYSSPIHTTIPLSKLKNHLFTLSDYRNVIPYLTTYYKENWGFCLTHNQFSELKDGDYEIFIDSSLENGHLSYGELYLPGKKEDEVLLSTYVCHPSMCNDNLSGISVLTFLAKYMMKQKLRYSYRFLFIPETIGSITWLSKNEEKVSKIKQGLVATCLGDSGKLTYKKTKDGNAVIDRIAQKVLEESNAYQILDFFPTGSDERQFNSPGFNLPIGSLMRTPYGCFKEYHTSADNLNFVKPQFLEDSIIKYSRILEFLEQEDSLDKQVKITQSDDKILENSSKNVSSQENFSKLKFISLNPKCEPQLGRRGLYSSIGGHKNQKLIETAILWVLNFSDGKNTLLDISIRSKIDFEKIRTAAKALENHKLLKLISD